MTTSSLRPHDYLLSNLTAMIKADHYIKYAQEKEDPSIKNPPCTKFKAGNKMSRGKPKGAPDWRTELAEGMKKAAPEIVEKAIQSAKKGNSKMIKLLVDKVVPDQRSEFLSHRALCKVKSNCAESLRRASDRITEALSKNLITPDQALKAQHVLEGHIRIENAIKLEERVKALEDKMNSQSKNISLDSRVAVTYTNEVGQSNNMSNKQA
jgi:hypothetical protein